MKGSIESDVGVTHKVLGDEGKCLISILGVSSLPVPMVEGDCVI